MRLLGVRVARFDALEGQADADRRPRQQRHRAADRVVSSSPRPVSVRCRPWPTDPLSGGHFAEASQ